MFFWVCIREIVASGLCHIEITTKFINKTYASFQSAKLSLQTVNAQYTSNIESKLAIMLMHAVKA